MDPVNNSWCNFTYLGPAPDIGDLACRRETVDGRPVVRSYWKPTEAELEQLNNFGTICLSIFSEPIPPVSLGVVTTPEDMRLKDLAERLLTE